MPLLLPRGTGSGKPTPGRHAPYGNSRRACLSDNDTPRAGHRHRGGLALEVSHGFLELSRLRSRPGQHPECHQCVPAFSRDPIAGSREARDRPRRRYGSLRFHFWRAGCAQDFAAQTAALLFNTPEVDPILLACTPRLRESRIASCQRRRTSGASEHRSSQPRPKSWTDRQAPHPHSSHHYCSYRRTRYEAREGGPAKQCRTLLTTSIALPLDSYALASSSDRQIVQTMHGAVPSAFSMR